MADVDGGRRAKAADRANEGARGQTFWRHFWGKEWFRIVFAACGLGGGVALAACLPEFWSTLEGGFSVATLLVAVAVWYGEARERWLQSLEKRMTVRFTYEESGCRREVMRCEAAYLAHEGDLRNWAQQLGRQMAGGGKVQLSFHPDLEVGGPTLEHSDDDKGAKRYYQHYEITSRLKGLGEEGSRLRKLADLAGEGKRSEPWILWARPTFRDERDPDEGTAQRA